MAVCLEVYLGHFPVLLLFVGTEVQALVNSHFPRSISEFQYLGHQNILLILSS